MNVTCYGKKHNYILSISREKLNDTVEPPSFEFTDRVRKDLRLSGNASPHIVNPTWVHQINKRTLNVRLGAMSELLAPDIIQFVDNLITALHKTDTEQERRLQREREATQPHHRGSQPPLRAN